MLWRVTTLGTDSISPQYFLERPLRGVRRFGRQDGEEQRVQQDSNSDQETYDRRYEWHEPDRVAACKAHDEKGKSRRKTYGCCYGAFSSAPERILRDL